MKNDELAEHYDVPVDMVLALRSDVERQFRAEQVAAARKDLTADQAAYEAEMAQTRTTDEVVAVAAKYGRHVQPQ